LKLTQTRLKCTSYYCQYI